MESAEGKRNVGIKRHECGNNYKRNIFKILFMKILTVQDLERIRKTAKEVLALREESNRHTEVQTCGLANGCPHFGKRLSPSAGSDLRRNRMQGVVQC